MTSERLPYSQAGRMTAVSTRLGADVLLLTHLEIDERVNALFEIGAAVSTTHLRQSRLAARPASQLCPPTAMHHVVMDPT